MNRFRFLFLAVLLLAICFSCSRDHAKIDKLKKHLTSDKHTKHLQKITHSIDFFRMGFDNLVLKNQLDSLQQATDSYITFVKAYRTRDNSVRQQQQAILEPVAQFRRSLMDLQMRLDAFQNIRSKLDSLQQSGNKVDIHQLERKEQSLRKSLTNNELIQLQIELLNRLNQAIKNLADGSVS